MPIIVKCEAQETEKGKAWKIRGSVHKNVCQPHDSNKVIYFNKNRTNATTASLQNKKKHFFFTRNNLLKFRILIDFAFKII